MLFVHNSRRKSVSIAQEGLVGALCSGDTRRPLGKRTVAVGPHSISLRKDSDLQICERALRDLVNVSDVTGLAKSLRRKSSNNAAAQFFVWLGFLWRTRIVMLYSFSARLSRQSFVQLYVHGASLFFMLAPRPPDAEPPPRGGSWDRPWRSRQK